MRVENPARLVLPPVRAAAPELLNGWSPALVCPHARTRDRAPRPRAAPRSVQVRPGPERRARIAGRALRPPRAALGRDRGAAVPEAGSTGIAAPSRSQGP